MLSVPVNTDPTYTEPTSYSRLDRFFLKLIRDKRDLPFVYLLIRVTVTLIPMGAVIHAIRTELALVDHCLDLSLINNITYKALSV